MFVYHIKEHTNTDFDEDEVKDNVDVEGQLKSLSEMVKSQSKQIVLLTQEKGVITNEKEALINELRKEVFLYII